MEQRKILIVDDNEVDVRMISLVLEKKGFKTISLPSGEGCLELIESEKPSIILLDILMPGLPGDQVLHLIREKHSAITLPVIMISGKTDASDIVESLCLGANDYITKPIDFEVALMRIYTHLKIADLSREMSRLREAEAVNAMIATYNHEINNPLAIALGSLKILLDKHRGDGEFSRLEQALWRIADVVKKIDGIIMKGDLQYGEYTKTSKMLKLK